MTAQATPLEPKFLAAIDLIRRTGARSVQVRYSDEPEPIVWFVVAEHFIDGRGMPTSGHAEPVKRTHYSVGAGLNPLRAALICVESMIDGGTCAHCSKPTAFDTDDDMTASMLPWACLTRYNPITEQYNNGCGGRHPDPAPTGDAA